MGGASSLFAEAIVSDAIRIQTAGNIPRLAERDNSRSRAHLSALALETTDALLSPLISHLRSAGWLVSLDDMRFGGVTHDLRG